MKPGACIKSPRVPSRTWGAISLHVHRGLQNETDAGPDADSQTAALPEATADYLDTMPVGQVAWLVVDCCQSAIMGHFETEHMGMVMRGVSAP